MNKTRAINKALYEVRLKKKESLKSASKALGISKLRLSLIEKGYLFATKKLQPKLISHYKLEKNFFTTHTNYIEPISVHEDKDEVALKIRQTLSAKPVRIITATLSLIGAGLLAFGIYTGHQLYSNPRVAWTENFTQFKENMMSIGTKEHDVLVGDDYYHYPIEEGTLKLDTRIYVNDLNAVDSCFVFDNDETSYDINFELAAFNKRVIAYTSYTDSSLEIDSASCFIEGKNLNLRPFNYTKDGISGKAKPGDAVYEKIKPIVERDLNKSITTYNNKVLAIKDFKYKDVRDALIDIRAISRDYVSKFTLSYDLKMGGGIGFGVMLSCFLLSLLIKPKTKVKTKEKPAVKFSLASVSLPTRDLPNDVKTPLIFPEFLLRILGLAIILFFAIGLNIATAWRINSGLLEEIPKKITMLQEISSNLFVAGTTLLFFLKLDIYHKKTQKDLLTNIFILFVVGLIYYVMEVVLYTSVEAEFMNGGDIYTSIMLILTTFLPGNIIWNLMLYSCIFYFLFITPKKCQDSLHKTLRFRLLSLIPTLFLLVSFIYQTFIKPVAPAPYFISCIFFTKGFLITLFAIVYLYALYFLQTYYRFRFGEETARIYFYSRRYNFIKNVMASIIIVILFGIDLFFMYKMPNNSLNLGNNWAIILIVPLVLFYCPHIGKRNAKWDSIFMVLYILFFAGGFISVISQIASLFDFSQLAEILN